MKPKGRRSRNSTSFSPPRLDRNTQNATKSRHSVSSFTLQDSPDETLLFDTLMKDPLKRALVLRMLSQEKDNIVRYKQNEEKKNLAKLGDKTNKRVINQQRLLHCESPTALLRRRALEKNRRQSDSSLSTSSEPKSMTPSPVPLPSLVPSPVPFNQLLEGVVAYVEIRSKEGDRSAGAKALMQSMGATVMDRFVKNVTHVLFKDGSFSTYQKAKLMKVHLVSILWLEAVRTQNVRVPEKNYPALGTEAYDVNISAICQDYEEVVRDEYRRSLAVATASSTQSKGRKTCLPSELQSIRNDWETSSNSSSRSFHSAKKIEVVPSSQDWEAESVISYESAYPPFRKAVPTLLEDDGKLLTSDSDSDCGVINGHSVKHVQDSLLVDLDLVNDSFEKRNIEPLTTKEIRETLDVPLNANEQSTTTNNTTSSSRSVSLLSRKSVSARKSSYSIVDMDLTTNVLDNGNKIMNNEIHDNNKENLKAVSRKSCDVAKKKNKENSANLKNKTNERKTIDSVSDLKTNATDSLRNSLASNTDTISLQTTGSSTCSLSRITFKKPIANIRKTSSNIEISSSSINDKEQKGQNSECLNKYRSSEKIIPASKRDINLRMSTGSLADKVEKPKARSKSFDQCSTSETIEVNQSKKAQKENSLNSENMSPLRISTDNSSNVVEKLNRKENSGSFDHPTKNTQKTHKENSVNSENMSPLRISTDNSSNAVEKLNRKKNSESFDHPTKSTKKTHKENSINSENMSPLRISTDNSSNAVEKLNRKENSLNSEDMSPLRISADNSSNAMEKRIINNFGCLDLPTKSTVRTSAEIVADQKKTSLNSEDIPSLRVSTDSSNNTTEKNSNIVRKSNRKSVKLRKDKSLLSREQIDLKEINEEDDLSKQFNNASRRSTRISKKTTQKGSLNSEDLPPLRISTDSTTKTGHTLGTTKNSLSDGTNHSLEVNVSHLSKLKSTSAVSSDNTSFNSRNFSPLDENMVDTIIKSLESPKKSVTPKISSPDKGEGDHKILIKRKQPEHDEQSTSKRMSREGKNKKLRKLYNVNQSVSETFKTWDSQNTVIGNNSVPVSAPVNRTEGNKQLTVLLTPFFASQNAVKFLKSQKLNNKGTTPKAEIKLKKQKTEPNKEKSQKHVKSSKKVHADGDKDEQKDLANEYVTRKKSASKRKHKGEEDGSQSPKKQAVETQCRRSVRLGSHKLSYKDSSLNSDIYKTSIMPELNRRSTLEFAIPTLTKTQRKNSQKKKKTKSSIVCTRMHKPEVQTFMQIVKKLGTFFVEDEVSRKTTHLVVGECKRTINLLRAITRGCWILTKEWLYKSLEAGKWLPEEDFELTTFSSAVEVCRKQRQAFGPLYSMDIFSNCGPIYIARGTNPRYTDLEELVMVCKGTVLKAIYNASIVVGEWVRYDNVICVSEKWILDSITFNKKRSFKNYLLKGRSSEKNI